MTFTPEPSFSEWLRNIMETSSFYEVPTKSWRTVEGIAILGMSTSDGFFAVE